MASKNKNSKITKITVGKDKKTPTKQKKIHKNNFIKSVYKRDGTIVPFDIEKIANAINKAMLAVGEGSEKEAMTVANKVLVGLEKKAKEIKGFIPKVEEIQDMVEAELMLADYVKASKSYILYREERSKLRAQGFLVPARVKKLADQSKKYFRNQFSEFIYYRTYAKWIEDEGRRETWIETVDRYIAFMRKNLGNKLKEKEYEEVREAILKQEVMPSMRLMQFAGKAAERTNVCAYNCSFIAPSTLQDFGETIYILMCGTGVGFSVESKNIQALPQIKIQNGKKLPTFVVPDTKKVGPTLLFWG